MGKKKNKNVDFSYKEQEAIADELFMLCQNNSDLDYNSSRLNNGTSVNYENPFDFDFEQMVINDVTKGSVRKPDPDFYNDEEEDEERDPSVIVTYDELTHPKKETKTAIVDQKGLVYANTGVSIYEDDDDDDFGYKDDEDDEYIPVPDENPANELMFEEEEEEDERVDEMTEELSSIDFLTYPTLNRGLINDGISPIQFVINNDQIDAENLYDVMVANEIDLSEFEAYTYNFIISNLHPTAILSASKFNEIFKTIEKININKFLMFYYDEKVFLYNIDLDTKKDFDEMMHELDVNQVISVYMSLAANTKNLFSYEIPEYVDAYEDSEFNNRRDFMTAVFLDKDTVASGAGKYVGDKVISEDLYENMIRMNVIDLDDLVNTCVAMLDKVIKSITEDEPEPDPEPVFSQPDPEPVQEEVKEEPEEVLEVRVEAEEVIEVVDEDSIDTDELLKDVEETPKEEPKPAPKKKTATKSSTTKKKTTTKSTTKKTKTEEKEKEEEESFVVPIITKGNK